MRFISTMTRALVASAALVAFAHGTASAQTDYPTRPVNVIVPQGAGGANDTIARIISAKLSEVLGQQFVVENRTGAGGNIGTAAVAKAKPDGYTLMLTTNGAQVINPWLYKTTGFDPIKDFTPVGLVASAGYVLVANAAFPANNVNELIAQLKANPGKYNYASAGNGTLNHLIMEMFKQQVGLNIQHVPYKTASAAAADVAGGIVPVSVQSAPSSLGLIKAGKIKALAVTNEKRIGALPDVPSISETIPGFGSTPWYGILAPAGTPEAIVNKLNAAIKTALADKDVQERLLKQGCEPLESTPQQFATLIKDDLANWQKIVKSSGASVD
ncbi:Bug family tripartite tricarboxylate transporter substrate binding protein [Zwartia panacis]|uniref:Bug family tripartite tricarboxylate transporter substrate binding protein n=1 Tax=Zwartia panacis TaxID=2683345 RepID=UPI0025B2AC4F|nr:tripartite tricarboxylate transporter substrate binding protein [Zwartia panacis]MDN4016111.1 tripartite tricarboxylate transporter substrate binding protein [Zwartia panacis]